MTLNSIELKPGESQSIFIPVSQISSNTSQLAFEVQAQSLTSAELKNLIHVSIFQDSHQILTKTSLFNLKTPIKLEHLTSQADLNLKLSLDPTLSEEFENQDVSFEITFRTVDTSNSSQTNSTQSETHISQVFQIIPSPVAQATTSPTPALLETEPQFDSQNPTQSILGEATLFDSKEISTGSSSIPPQLYAYGIISFILIAMGISVFLLFRSYFSNSN